MLRRRGAGWLKIPVVVVVVVEVAQPLRLLLFPPSDANSPMPLPPPPPSDVAAALPPPSLWLSPPPQPSPPVVVASAAPSLSSPPTALPAAEMSGGRGEKVDFCKNVKTEKWPLSLPSFSLRGVEAARLLRRRPIRPPPASRRLPGSPPSN